MRSLYSFSIILFISLISGGSAEIPVDTYHLVDLADKGILFDIRYATPDNFTHCQLYPFAKAYLHKDATVQLLHVHEDLRSRGLGLKVFDAYRPLSVQQKMWDLIQDERYVSNPTINGGRHTRGTAVDVMVVDSQGNKLDMPTDFDDFTDKAHQDYSDLSENQKNNRTLLREVMEKYGFEPHPFEWWHFDLKGWQNYPVLDVDFIALAPKL